MRYVVHESKIHLHWCMAWCTHSPLECSIYLIPGMMLVMCRVKEELAENGVTDKDIWDSTVLHVLAKQSKILLSIHLCGTDFQGHMARVVSCSSRHNTIFRVIKQTWPPVCVTVCEPIRGFSAEEPCADFLGSTCPSHACYLRGWYWLYRFQCHPIPCTLYLYFFLM